MRNETARGGSGAAPGAGGVGIGVADDQKGSRKRLRKLPKNTTMNLNQ